MVWSIIQKGIMVVPVFLGMVQTIALVVTAIIVGLYTRETYKLRKEARDQTKELKQANTFNAITRVHERLANFESYKIRGYLHAGFIDHLVLAASKLLENKYVSGIGKQAKVDVSKVLDELREDNDQLLKFNAELDSHPASFRGYRSIDVSALDAVEQTLVDFDLIAIPYSLGINSAKKLAEAYEPVLRRTSTAILPFVAIQLMLRGSNDPGYKRYYLYLLKELKIPLQGIPAPDNPWDKKYTRM